ncbi:four helix bundle protein [Pedobacter sp. Leaf132]|uniref:four helix bundle protein n=1 Tax=Pedobacter sp. Leaf132 TaxID=2876557 RepID=UPI001E611AFD|nr:four helix bundle protein [Pedobacter sp. Leaf132]
MYYNFTEMPVWKLAMEYAVSVFNLTTDLPKQEDYALTSQIRRSSLSISDNLAEGFGRETNLDKKRFYVMSRGSLLESKNQLIYGRNVGYFDVEKGIELIAVNEKIHFELNKLIKSLKS